eukprot:TRINITY_DN5498_c0_g1_i3.p1 TRINITY_DN5498_c0_g1~~TRINITY_DN5498_c0_g1_i3.p1  ORF type:complete len:198 (-),score=2.93 TRINITY_DN5498_c0_g1_i3:206-799(-)
MGEQEKVGQFCRRVKQLADDLKIAGQDISELTLVSYILGGLTDYYKQVKCVLQLLPHQDLKFSKILAKLEVIEMEREEEKIPKLQTSKKLLYSTPPSFVQRLRQQDNRVCFMCGRVGHIARRCIHNPNNHNNYDFQRSRKISSPQNSSKSFSLSCVNRFKPRPMFQNESVNILSGNHSKKRYKKKRKKFKILKSENF